MPASGSPSCRPLPLVLACIAVIILAPPPAGAQGEGIDPVTDAELQDPSPDDWLMWRRTLDGWGYSPLDQIDRENVGALRMVWSRALTGGRQQGTPLVHDGVLYMPNPNDVIQALDAVTGDLLWEHRREVPEDISDYIFGLSENNRNLAIHGTFILDTSVDDHVFALDAASGRLAWETEIVDYRVNPAMQTSGPIVADGKVVSGRSCMPMAGPEACVITAHDAGTGEELWRTRLIPAPGEPGDETWGGVPFEERRHVGAWMVPELRPRAEPDLRGNVGYLPGPQVPPRRDGQPAPLPQLDARPRRRHRRHPLVLPAPERPLGPRPPLRAAAGRHRGCPRPGGGELDQPAAPAGGGAAGGDRDSRQDRRRLHPRPRDRASSSGRRRRLPRT